MATSEGTKSIKIYQYIENLALVGEAPLVSGHNGRVSLDCKMFLQTVLL